MLVVYFEVTQAYRADCDGIFLIFIYIMNVASLRVPKNIWYKSTHLGMYFTESGLGDKLYHVTE